MFGMKLTLLAFGTGILIGAIPAGYYAYKFNDNRWVAATEKLKSEAAVELQKATEKVLQVERENANLATKMDVEHAKSEKTLRNVLNENRRLVSAVGGLRDQGRRSSGSDTLRSSPSTSNHFNGSSAKPNIPGESNGVLSSETSEFILELAYEADQAALFAKTCYDWIQEIKKDPE